MTPDEYINAALRTEFTPDFVRLVDRTTGTAMPDEHNVMVARLLHALMGMVSEVGEFADALKKHIIYGKALDQINLLEESGDRSWYESLFLSAVQQNWEASWQRNIAKLRIRFPDKFSEANALTRNLDAERAALAP